MPTSSGVRRSIDQLNGKIRVSVVATGIDNDGMAAAPATARPFAFSRPAEPEPAPEAPAASSLFGNEPEAAVETEEDGSLDLAAADNVETLDREDEETEVAAAETSAFSMPSAEDEAGEFAGDDDLLELGDADVVAETEEEVLADVAPPSDRPAPRISTGGTLFERMSNLSRGLSRSDEEEAGKAMAQAVSTSRVFSIDRATINGLRAMCIRRVARPSQLSHS